MVSRIFNITYLLFTLMLASNTWAAQINVQADRSELTEDESFTLVFESQQSVDDDPDFAPLEKDFRILSRNQSSNIQIINGKMSRQAQWTLTLLPKQPGKFTLPPIAFGKDRSNQLTVTVNPATQQNNALGDSPVYFELSADVDEAYVQSQIIVTARIYHAVNLMNASLSDMELSDKTAVVEELEGDARYEKRAGNRRYKVIEKRYAIFPRMAGQLTIEPQSLEVQFVSSRRALTTKRLRSELIHIKINPPVELNGKQSVTWLPARSLILSEEFPKQAKAYRVGDPITRTVRLAIEGLPPEMLPELDFYSDKSFKSYPERPVLDKQSDANGVTGVRQETVALVPTAAGTFQLPALNVPWFNTESKQWETASLPSRTIKIEAPEGSTAGNADKAIMAEQVKESQNSATKETLIPETTPESTVVTTLVQARNDSNYWRWAAALFFCLWLVTAAVWWLSKKRIPKVSSTQNTVALKHQSAVKAVQAACRRNDALASKDALLRWANTLGFSSKVTSLSGLALLISDPLATEVKKLNNHLYSSPQPAWNGENLLHAFKAHKMQSKTPMAKPGSELEPMYYAFDKQG